MDQQTTTKTQNNLSYNSYEMMQRNKKRMPVDKQASQVISKSFLSIKQNLKTIKYSYYSPL